MLDVCWSRTGHCFFDGENKGGDGLLMFEWQLACYTQPVSKTNRHEAGTQELGERRTEYCQQPTTADRKGKE